VSVDRLSVAEAAEALGVTRDAIHKRITRGTIEHEKGEDGRFYVFVDTSTERLDLSTDTSVDKSKVEALERLIDSQHDRIAFLERELDRRGDETIRLQQIVAGLTQANAQLAARVPELEAPQEATEDAETVEETPEGVEPRPATGGAQEGARRPWWRRVLGR
jgi:DNA-binding LacI/PurR family transcriptional regulator